MLGLSLLSGFGGDWNIDFSYIGEYPICHSYITSQRYSGIETPFLFILFIYPNINDAYEVDILVFTTIQITSTYIEAVRNDEINNSISVEKLSELIDTYQMGRYDTHHFHDFMEWQTTWEEEWIPFFSEDLGEDSRIHYCMPPHIDLELLFSEIPATEAPAQEPTEAP
jgi:hypothetical protein